MREAGWCRKNTKFECHNIIIQRISIHKFRAIKASSEEYKLLLIKEIETFFSFRR